LISPPAKGADLGSWGELMAKNYLCSKGYRVVQKNFRSFFGEIDLIMEDAGQIVFVEVKVRKKPWMEGREGLNHLKLRRISKMVSLWGMKNGGNHVPVRLDCVFLMKKVHYSKRMDYWILEHIRNAL